MELDGRQAVSQPTPYSVATEATAHARGLGHRALATAAPRPMTSSTKSWDGPSPTGSTTWPTTRAGSPSATSPTPPLRSRGHPALVALDGTAPGSQHHQALDHRRCRRSNGYRVKLWKVELAELAHEIGLEMTVVHTHRERRSGTGSSTACSASSTELAWSSARVLSDHRRTDLEHDHSKGLNIRAEEDLNYYETGTKVSAAELAAVPLCPTSSTATGTT